MIVDVNVGAAACCVIIPSPRHSVNRNRSVRFFGYWGNSVTWDAGTDRLIVKHRTEQFRFRVIQFDFGSTRDNRNLSRHRKNSRLALVCDLTVVWWLGAWEAAVAGRDARGWEADATGRDGRCSPALLQAVGHLSFTEEEERRSTGHRCNTSGV
jgi:hypothetical protein